MPCSLNNLNFSLHGEILVGIFLLSPFFNEKYSDAWGSVKKTNEDALSLDDSSRSLLRIA